QAPFQGGLRRRRRSGREAWVSSRISVQFPARGYRSRSRWLPCSKKTVRPRGDGLVQNIPAAYPSYGNSERVPRMGGSGPKGFRGHSYDPAVASTEERREALKAVYREAKGCIRCPQLAATRTTVV